MAKSFIKWAGGKHQIINDIHDIIDSMREPYKEFIYVEPFVGGGAVLFSILERCSNLKYAIITDTNEKLINCYKVISDDHKYYELKNMLFDIQNRYNKSENQNDFYLKIKDIYNSDDEKSDIYEACLFIFLNKTCFNGIYRENSKGKFNVSWNKKTYVNLYSEDELDKIHYLLREKVIILSGDYHICSFSMDIARIENCGLIFYMDPPCRPDKNTIGFVNYTNSDFNDVQQEQLKLYCDAIDKNGYKFVLSNYKSDNYFESLYSKYNINVIQTRRNISSNNGSRGKVHELLIHNMEKRNVGLF